MSSRESSLGSWSDKIPSVDRWDESKSWDCLVAEEMRISPEEAMADLRKISLVALMGVGLFLAAGALLVLKLGFADDGQTTQGTVVALDERPSRHGSVYAPVVAYRVNGFEYEIEGSLASSLNLYDVGDQVPVSYDTADPSSAVIYDFHQVYFLPCLLSGGGVLFLLAAGGLAAYVMHQAGWKLSPASPAI